MLDKEEDLHDPFKFTTIDPLKYFFSSKLLFNDNIYEWLSLDNGDINTIVPSKMHHNRWTF